MAVEPVPGEPAAVVDCGDRRVLAVADYHAGLEAGLRSEGVELASRARQRRERLCAILDRTRADGLVVLGDLGHAIGTPGRDEREELETLLSAVAERVPVTLLAGNHDGALGALEGYVDGLTLAPAEGTRLGSVGFAHGHTWPGREVLAAEALCTGHEHPVVRLEDEVGGSRVERVWLRGRVDPAPFERFHDVDTGAPDELVVFPAFNDLSGGTRVNVHGEEFLSPFLPEALVDGEAYLLDGTRLGRYDAI